jgi:hypothetical protein
MRTRFPFQYGIASLSEITHLLVRVTIEIDGQVATGVSAEGLAPKWFTKNPHTSFDEVDAPEMLRAIDQAAKIAIGMPASASLFRWWQSLYEIHHDWAHEHDIEPLLASFGVSLIERAVIDAVCHLRQTCLFEYLKSNGPGIVLGDVRPELRPVTVDKILPAQPRSTLLVRHTVGLSDPLSSADLNGLQRPDDGLPLTLEENIRIYGLRYFKIKLSGDLERDRQRLSAIAEIVAAKVGEAKITLDANEQFASLEAFRSHYQDCRSLLSDFFERSLLFVEQPIDRKHALGQSADEFGMSDWLDRPPIIIDESDADLDSLPTALAIGYCGTSHKNCKGIIKGIVNAASLFLARTEGRRVILSAEDLANVGPVALPQDLAMVAALGIDHVERNGHHYFAGLSSFPAAEQQRVLAAHGDLYQQHPRGFVTLAVNDGKVDVGTVVRAPFGYADSPDLTFAEPLK